jgi:hypothetical protein
LHAALADSAAAAGDLGGVARYAPLAEEAARAVGHRLYEAIALRALGVAATRQGEGAEAAARFDAALVIFEDLGTPWQLGITLAHRSQSHLARRDQTAARTDLERAAASFESIGAHLAAQRARETLAAIG